MGWLYIESEDLLECKILKALTMNQEIRCPDVVAAGRVLYKTGSENSSKRYVKAPSRQIASVACHQASRLRTPSLGYAAGSSHSTVKKSKLSH